MLEERWRQIVAAHTGEFALHDAALERSWTFEELAAAADAAEPQLESGLVCPRGVGVDFVLSVLRAWRAQSAVCPLEAGQAVPAIPPPPVGIAHLKTTSGTTGAAKVVAFTAAQLAADAANIVATMGLRHDWPNLGVISLAHSYGFSNLVTPLLLHGIPLILLPSALPAMLAAQAARWPALTLAAVPVLWRTWHEAGAIPASVKLAISAGAPLPLVLEEEVFRSRGLKLHNFLGASECGGIAYDRTETPRNDAALVGTALEGVFLEASEAGCLVVKGAAVGATYWPVADDCLAEGRFQTADLVALDSAGGVWLKGRASDLINVAGRKVSPEQVEAALRQHPAVRDCLVLGVPANDSRGETVAAVVELRETAGESALRDFLLDRLPSWQVPRNWRFVETLAANARGKLSRAEWRSRWLT